MDAERWHRIEELFHAVLDRPADARRHALEQAGADPGLVDDVLALLAEHDADPGFLEQPAVDLAGTAEPSEAPGTRIGAYRIVRPVGRGGMGHVYCAVRDDGTYERQVALKLIRRGLDTDDLLRRFRAERRILAALDHPNIAAILDGGTAPDGRPYLVMEYVDGEPITGWCQARRLPLEARLRLFRAVCEAVQHAHRKLIVHRDLKPDNILVAADGTPKLLDFGIAKLLDPGADGSVPVTRADTRILTPQYASPEQIRGDAITTASDVYSLGVILYELVAGRRPYEVTGGRDRLRAVLDSVPERPSRAVSAAGPGEGDGTGTRQLARRLSGDVDNIVLKAMHRDPERRYGSARELADDITRHLDGHPVIARPDTLGYRAGKFVRRHRWSLATAAAVVALVLGFGAWTALQARQIRLQAEEVARAHARGQRVLAFLEGLFEAADPAEARGRETTARDLLDRGAARVARDLREDPAARADMLAAIARAYRGLGAYARAETLALAALDARRTLPGGDAERARETALLGDLAAERGDYAAAERWYREALATERRLGADRVEVARDLDRLGLLFYERGELDSAETLYRSALALQRRVRRSDDPSIAYVLNNLALLLKSRGRYGEADSLYRESLALRRALLGPDHPDVATTLANLGRLHHDLASYPEAERFLREALAADQRILGPEHPYVLADRANLAGLLYERAEYAAAESMLVDVLARRRAVLGDGHPHVAFTLTGLARVRHARGRHADAVATYREVLRALGRSLGEAHPAFASALGELGASLAETGDLAGAEERLRDAVARLERAQGAGHPAAAAARARLAVVLARRAEWREAESLLREAMDAAAAALPAGHPVPLTMAAQLGAVLTDAGRAAEAEPLLRGAVAGLEARLGAVHPRTAEARLDLARCWLALGRHEEGVALARAARDALGRRVGPEHPLVRRAAAVAAR